MKRNVIIIALLLIMMPFYGQLLDTTITENFDGNPPVTFTSIPATGAWSTHTAFAVSSPNSYRSRVPVTIGDTTELVTPMYDLTLYTYVQLRFWHICKISPRDKVVIEYQFANSTTWTPIPNGAYLGSASNYGTTSFNANSYAEWQGNDSTAQPSASWWREEIFNVGPDVKEDYVRFRFLLIHGSAPNTNVSYGWLLDDFEIRAANYEIKDPVVQFTGSYPRDTVRTTGPWEINAKVATRTAARIEQPYLEYTTNFNGTVTGPISILMANIAGDSLWRATIPQHIAGTEITYSITGRDTNGNHLTVSNNYYIKPPTASAGTLNDIIIGTGTTRTYGPVSGYYGYERNVSLYKPGDGLKVGEITGLSWNNPNNSRTVPTKVYLKEVTVNELGATSTLIWNDLILGATKVYDGSFSFTASTPWVSVPLSTLFSYTGSGNLMVLVECNTGGTGGSSAEWAYSITTDPNTHAHLREDNSTDDALTFDANNASGNTSTTARNANRPNIRLEIQSQTDTLSAALKSINLAQQIFTSSTTNVPVEITVKNIGIQNLSTFTINWSVNGVLQIPAITWTGNLPWDFNTDYVIGNYTPRLEMYDTIQVWISDPNGKGDPVTNDDTLVVYTYGLSGIEASFIMPSPIDTVYHTGPYTVTAKLTSRTSVAISVPVKLKYTVTYGGETVHDSVVMISKGGDVWEGIIPEQAYKSNITYSISLIDSLGNTVIIDSDFYVRRFTSGELVFTKGTTTGEKYPFNFHFGHGLSMYLYTEDEMNNFRDITIDTLSFRVKTARSFTKNIKIWLKTIDASKTEWSSTTDNLDWSVHTSDAVLVYDGDYSFSDTGWMNIPLQNTFTYNNGNLVVLCEAYYGGSGTSSYPEFYYSSGNTNKHWKKEKDTNPIDQTTALTINSNRADIKFKVFAMPLVANSAALTKIVSPVMLATAGTSTPIVINLKNIGEDTLKSATLYWEVNGLQQSMPWAGLINEGFSVDVPVADYTPSLGKQDTLKIWVSLPNGVVDPNVKDDTVTAYIFGCGMLNSNGEYIIGTGTGSDFNTLGEAFHFFKLCQTQGNIKLILQDGNYTDPVDFASIAEYRSANDTISVVSISGNPANVTIKPSTTAVTVGSNNFILKNVTLESTNGIAFAKPCKNISITNTVITMPKSSSATGYGIRTLTDSATLENVLVRNCTIEGGQYGIAFVGKELAIHKNIRIDSNIFTDQCSFGCLLNYGEIQSVSYNSIKSIGTYISSSEWGGIAVQYGKAKTLIANNKIHVPTSATEFEAGIYLYQNDSAVKVVNNEINLHLSSSGYYVYYENYGIVDINPQGDQILHNSIRASSVSGSYNYPTGVYFDLAANDSIIVQNNNIVTAGAQAYAIYLDSYNSALQPNYKWGGNNYSSSYRLGYAGNDKNDLTAWKQEFTTDNSISLQPYYVDSTVNLELRDYLPFLTNSISTVTHDINDKLRGSNKTAIGAYEIELSPNQSLVLESINWKKELVNNETQSIELSVLNLSSQPASSITFIWEKDGQSQPPYTWTPSVPLASLESANVKIDEFSISTDHDVRIWATVNEQEDTVSVSSKIIPLAKFAQPFIDDTIHTLSFDVYTQIHTLTGAPTVNPRMNLQTTVNNAVIFYDTIDMVPENELWVAHIPQQYYGSEVIYSVMVSDNIGNTITLMDSTYLKFSAFGQNDSVIVGTGTSTSYYVPLINWYDRGWTRQIYLTSELDPNSSGGMITELAWEHAATSAYTRNNQYCYFRAIDITENQVVATYSDPITDGATLVWSGTYSIPAGPTWANIVLNQPFILPPGKNLMVYWMNDEGAYNTSPTFRYTSTSPAYMAVYGGADDVTTIPTSAGTTTYNRPNARFIMASPSEPYSGNNLSLSSIVSPVNVFGQICSDDSSSVQVSLINMGEIDYDFTQNPIDLYLELEDPILNYYTEHVHIDTGGLESGESMIVELKSSLPIMHAGRYDIKAWVSSNIDQVVYDDTIVSQFISGRISLPVDEDFSDGISPLVFVTTGSNSLYQWEAIPQGTDADTAVQPVFGTNMLSFTGTLGAAASLSVRQLQLQGTTHPTLEFWYFHDTLEVDDYISIEITQDGSTPYTRLRLIQKQDAVYGWKHYEVDLSPYTTGTCISILFEAVVMSPNTVQYIDRIRITSLQDVAVTGIITSELDVCNLKNKAWKVILGNGTPQRINFNTQPTAIQLNIQYNSKDTSFTHLLTSGIFEGNSVDTFELTTGFDFAKGTYHATASLTVPLDDNPVNDTYTTSIEIKPKINIEIHKLSQGGDALAGYEHNQIITIENTGNMDLSNIELILTVSSDKADGEEYHFSRTKTVGKNLSPGQKDTIKFDDPYTVPWASVYAVEVRGYLICNAAMLDTTVSVQENADIDDLSVIITNPINNGTIDTVDNLMTVSIEVKNRNIGTTHGEGDVKVWLQITDIYGDEKQTIERELPRIIGIAPIPYTFDEKYTVPELSEYYLTVFIQNKDSYADNDTVRILRQTDYNDVSILNVNKSLFMLKQNTPNPAKDKTIINYSIPQDGEILFNVYSVSGQLLHSQRETTTLGDHQIELNLSDYASGIYFYTMEYKGQRISKRMSITR
jgi:hypothetical protein